ncbi:MAG: penicillin-insensitive murein endopeptidase [Alphaproteobacteria bacterium]|nr:penicillin-insensitive murein endopeptidase [Alphaproteobacteria bacterium]
MPSPVRAAILCIALGLAACESKPTVAMAPSQPQPQATASTLSEDAPASRHFAAVRTGTTGGAEVIGSYTRGCLGGASQLPVDGTYWQVMNPSRNRAWGHPHLIAFVETLGERVAADGHRGLLVGDLAQPRGGPLPSDHTSHQVGLDADIWLTPIPARKLSASDLEDYEPPGLVNFNTLRVTSGFGDAQYSMLRRAAEADEVERIFISPPIKRAMCDRPVSGDRSWLRKLRPWTGHAAHMHVRLACPTGSADCKPQDEPPEGDGCGAELQSWFTDRSWMKPKPGTYVPREPMKLDGLPAECRRVLTERG